MPNQNDAGKCFEDLFLGGCVVLVFVALLCVTTVGVIHTMLHILSLF
jgi:hypothetical protein